jgi:hypothetical protein
VPNQFSKGASLPRDSFCAFVHGMAKGVALFAMLSNLGVARWLCGSLDINSFGLDAPHIVSNPNKISFQALGGEVNIEVYRIAITL